MMDVVESPGAPMSEETTATWMLGSPLGRFSSTVMNDGSCVSRFCRISLGPMIPHGRRTETPRSVERGR
jgi:hypothetical protein